MATGTFDNARAQSRQATGAVDIGHWCWLALRAMGSLKITVTMFALGTLLLFVGTLAQDEETIVDVKKAYFNSWVSTVPLDVFVPQTIWPHEVRYPYAFAIPGGAAVGLILLVNLVAAKLTRFNMRAKGGRYVAGLVLTIAGFFLVGLIVLSAHLGDGLQGEPPFSYDWLWLGVKSSAFLLAAGCLGWSIGWTPKTKVVRWTAWSLTAIFIGICIFLLVTHDAFRIPDPGLRIVWQLTKSLIVSAVLLAGLLCLFGRQGGNVLIHLGVGLLMLGQFIFGDAQREERISIFEGQRTQVAYEPDSVELVLVDSSGSDKNRVVAFDYPALIASKSKGTFLSAKDLPFEVRVDRWMENTKLTPNARPGRPENGETEIKGLGRNWKFEEIPKFGGAKSQTNLASATVTLRSKADQKILGSYGVSQLLNDGAVSFRPELDQVAIGDKTWELGLRFRRNYKAYSITLDDVVLEQYTGTAKPKDYSSFVKVSSPDGATLQEGRIWMNNPMRFRGETFYQSGYMSGEDTNLGVEQTTLQVVTNAGWLIPYVACVLSGLGMLVHFGGTFARFASRYDRNAFSESPESSERKQPKAGPSKLRFALGILVPLIVCAVFTGLVYKRMQVPKTTTDEIDWYAIGQIPTQYGGRIKPLSSSSSEVLEIISGKKEALTKEGHEFEPVQKTGKAIDSVHWIAAVFAQEQWVFDAPLIKIDAIEITSALNLKRHKSHRYSFNEVADGLPNVAPQIKVLARTRREDFTFEQQKLADVLEKLTTFRNLFDAYTIRAPRVDGDESMVRAQIERLQESVDEIRRRSPVAIIPPIDPAALSVGEKGPPPKWDAFGPALFDVVRLRNLGRDSKKESVLSFFSLVTALQSESKNPAEINQAVAKFKSTLNEEFGATIRMNKVDFEAWYEHFDPISLSKTFYVVAGLFALVSFALLRNEFRRTAFWLCVITLLVHTTAIVCRIYISERPPVVTLYSAAVFIGWSMVLFCTVCELLFPISISVLIASVAGFLSLQVAHALDIGDSMPVLQAVLDTQFWLSTHVISVSLGYSATFIAGFLGIAIIVAHWMSYFFSTETRLGVQSKNAIATLYRLCYGVVCFGLFFSFVGTVLGGLWGDDSWGRFWGWDPKENGAMMIVLWNALVLHARWDKMIGALGFGILAVFGNIITAWSMFGTNLLGVGLHAYGFNKDTFDYLFYFVLSQAVVIVVGLMVVALIKSLPSPETT